jgi:acyl carrier protein
MPDSVYSRVFEILSDVLQIDVPARITPESHIVNDLGAESLDIAEIAVAIETEFDLELETDLIDLAPTVQGLVDLIERELANQEIETVDS